MLKPKYIGFIMNFLLHETKNLKPCIKPSAYAKKEGGLHHMVQILEHLVKIIKELEYLDIQ